MPGIYTKEIELPAYIRETLNLLSVSILQYIYFLFFYTDKIVSSYPSLPVI